MHIAAHLDVDVVALENDDSVTVLLELEAPAAPTVAGPRPEHTAIVVLDRSGSMSGPRLEAARRALISLVDRLDDHDRFGLVTFDDTAEVVVAAGHVGGLGRDRVKHAIAGVQPGGMTDLSSGYLRGLQEARRVCGPAGATVALLSDGHANSGVTDPATLEGVARKASHQAITTSTIGIGTGYDEAILAALATGGSGNHSFAEHADAAAAAVAAEIDGLLSKTVQAASLLIQPSGDVAAVTVINDLPSQPVEGGILVELGDFYSAETRRLVLTIDVPAMAALGLAQVATLTLSYVELPSLEQHTVTVPVQVNVVPFDVAAGRVPAPQVRKERLFLEAQRAKKDSERQLADGDVDGARATLDAMTATLMSAPAAVMDQDMAAEADWLRETSQLLDSAGDAYNTRRLRSDRTRKSRGYKSRTQGGEVE